MEKQLEATITGKYLDIWDLCGQMTDIIHKRQVAKREIDAFFKLLAINLHLSRIYVFEYEPMRNLFKKAYGYNNSKAPVGDIDTISINELIPLYPLYNQENILLVDCQNPFFKRAGYSFLQNRGRLVLQYRISSNNQMTALIGMDIADENSQMLPVALKALTASGRVMKLLYLQQRMTFADDEFWQQMTNNLMHQAHMIVYATDDSHRMLYLQDNVHRSSLVEMQETCYQQLMGLERPCTDCPIKELQNKNEGSVQKEIYSMRYHQWFLVTCSIIRRSTQRQYLFTAVETTLSHLDKEYGDAAKFLDKNSMGQLMLSTGDICSTLEYATKSYIFYINRKTGQFYCSEALKKFIFHDGESWTVETLVAAVYPADRERLHKLIVGGIDSNLYYSYDLRIKMANGGYTKMLLRGREITMQQTGESMFWGAFILASQILDIDELTQLRNTRSFYNALKNNLNAKRMFSILVIDINNFSIVNYERSRYFGDRIIAKFANYLVRQAAKYRAECFRMLGDSFAVIFTQEDFLAIDRFYKNADGWLKSIYNIGVKGYLCNCPEDANDFDDLTRLLDYLQIITRQYRTIELVSYTPEAKKQFNRYIKLQKLLRRSMRNDFEGFYLVYQPYLNVQHDRLIGAEALARYRDEDGEEISPAEFIPVIEKLKLMCMFGRWVIKQALQAARACNEIYPGFIVNINISHEQLEDKQLFTYIIEMAQTIGVPLSCIELEFTEHFLSKEYEYINEKIAEIKQKGVKIAMDDFGTGYSSLGFLKSINVDIVKIDKIFLQDFLQDSVKKFFLECIINLCQKMNRCTILEGVELGEEYDEICRLGIDMVQGYYYSRPCKLDDVFKFIKAKTA